MTQRLRSTGPLRGVVQVPGDKSISHRALICNALAAGEAQVDGFLDGDDCRHTMACLEQLGVRIEREGMTLRVRSPGRARLRPAADPLDCGNSGTSMRLLAGLVAGLDGRSVLDGDASLRRRPMARVLRPLEQMGAVVGGGGPEMRAPIEVRGGALRPFRGRMTVPSAQVKSAILLAALAADGPSEIEEIAPTRDHTEIMLGAMGAAIEREGALARLDPRADLHPIDVEVPGDPSAAAFWLVAGSIVPGSEIELPGVCLNPTRTGAIDVLRSMGAQITVRNERQAGGELVGDLTVRAAELHGVVIGGELVPRAIDELPVLAVAAAVAAGDTEIRDAGELRVKESDRISATAGLLTAFGGTVAERSDGLSITGGTVLRPGVVDSGGDHRLAMAAAVAALAAPAAESSGPLSEIGDAGAVAVSYPGFWGDVALLAGPQALA